MKLKKFLLRYYPPGIILQYERDGQMKQKPIDLLDLTPDVDVEVGPDKVVAACSLTASFSAPAICFCRFFAPRSFGKSP